MRIYNNNSYWDLTLKMHFYMNSTNNGSVLEIRH